MNTNDTLPKRSRRRPVRSGPQAGAAPQPAGIAQLKADVARARTSVTVPAGPDDAAPAAHVAGIGASAGGLEAITRLIRPLPASLPCAYVVLQHLSPTYRSRLADILARETSLRVCAVAGGEVPQAGRIYVVPENHDVVLSGGALVLTQASSEIVPKPSIDRFLASLAAERGESAIGIVLSGTGSDGMAGLRAIRAAGGITLAQQPESARYDAMPRASIDAGVAQYVLTPDDIAARLPQLLALESDGADGPESADHFVRLLTRLKDVLGLDFSGYKPVTLKRRVRRRSVATGNRDLGAYLRWIDAHPDELNQLSRDILISVTSFFRDRDAWAALEPVVRALCEARRPGSEIRVWVAGCATGEEAYSLAMVFAEVLGQRLPQFRVQIFATDVDEEALNVARRGVYAESSMADVPPALRERYFEPLDSGFEVSKVLRDLIVFARHSLVADPPFLRLDLVACRNVLIYFDTALQTRVLQSFRFGLMPAGVLFLGRSESVAQADDAFIAIDRHERLFRRADHDAAAAPAAGAAGTPMVQMPPVRRERHVDVLLAGLVQHAGLVAVLCDPRGGIRYTAGPVERFLQLSDGAATLTLAELVVPALRGELLMLLGRWQRSGLAQRGRRRQVGAHWVRIGVQPLAGDDGAGTLVVFAPDEPPRPGAAQPDDAAETSEGRRIEQELVAARENLQTLVDELATSNEQMQALNEEAQAANEELQATNEELEATNEELQATNEELFSLNGELHVKTQQLSEVTDEYRHLYDALQFPILVFDRLLHLVRFNGPAARQFDLRVTALQQHVSRLRLAAPVDVLDALLPRALAGTDVEEQTVRCDGRIVRVTATPGLDRDGDVATLVVTCIDITEIAWAQSQLSESQARLSALMEMTTVIFAMKNLRGEYLYANRRFIDFFGLDAGGYAGRNDFAIMPPALAADMWNLDMTALRTREAATGEHEFVRGERRCWLRSVHQVLLDPAGQPSAFIIEAEDITAARHAEDQLRITARVFDQAGEAIVVTDAAGVIQTVNAAFRRITGFSADESVGRPAASLRCTRHGPEFYQGLYQSLRDTGFWQGEIWTQRKNGQVFPGWLTANRVAPEAGGVEHYVAVLSDITQIKDSQRKAQYLSTHDALTGLPNRSLFHDRLRHALAQARRDGSRLALLFIDLDNFKTINDTLGHDIGDDLLKEAGNRLREVVREVDTVARLGGDEFTAVLSDCTAESAEEVARRIVDDLSASFGIHGRSLFVSASIGIAMYPEDGRDSSSLVRAADAAMYRAKDLGRNRVEFFRADLHVHLLKRAALEGALREALRMRRLRLVYQPKYALAGGRALIGAEALLRWNDPELGEVAPGEFIPIAEASGLILDVGRMVEDLLLEQMAAWLRGGLPLPPIAFNVSPRSIREPDFADGLIGKIGAAAVPNGLVQVEITEGVLLENSSSVSANLAALDRAGLKVSIDDFGTGYSSLSYLKRLPISELKIDKSFINGLGHDNEDEAIAHAVLGLARALDLRTVAEGVETKRQLDWLERFGCDLAQGHLLGRPLEAGEFAEFLARRTGVDG